MNSREQHNDPGPTMAGRLRQDLREKDLTKSLRRDYQEAKEFLLDEQRRRQLERMGPWKLWFYSLWWLLKSMMLKLTPARRIVLVAGFALLFISRTSIYAGERFRVEVDLTPVGVACVLFVLMLELKDKLVAKEELAAGRAVQAAFLPPRSPEVKGWELWLLCRSANEVGGDLVDFIRVGDNRCSVVLGDVAGKGLPAALFMVKLQATLRALAPDYSSLKKLVSKLNQIFCRDGVKNVFASMIYADFVPGGDLVRLINAGHLPPMVVTKTKVEPLPKGGAAIGIFPGATFDEQEVKLQSGDLLCLFSDGLTEAQNGTGQMFGEDRLREFLTANAGRPLGELGENLMAEIDRFIGDSTSHDDLSLALIKKGER